MGSGGRGLGRRLNHDCSPFSQLSGIAGSTLGDARSYSSPLSISTSDILSSTPELNGDYDEDPDEELNKAAVSYPDILSVDRHTGTVTPSASPPECRRVLDHFPHDVDNGGANGNVNGVGNNDCYGEDESGNLDVNIRQRMPDVDEADLRNGVKSVIKLKW